jgi:GH15 family glucan-1,4-alpha-glucosidase
MHRKISDYAMIGDCETAAIVSRTGAVEWFCWPSFDSDACFAALVGEPANGHWTLAPKAAATRIERRYRQDTLVLETRFETAEGRLLLIDFMPPRADGSHLLRRVVCEAGTVRVCSTLALRFDYGLMPPWLMAQDGQVTALSGPHGVRLASKVPLEIHDGECTAELELRAGEQRDFALTYFPSHLQPPAAPDFDAALEYTSRWWADWVGKCSYDGPWREAVTRSLITLKALIYRPTGGVVAAATSSLPEHPGGSRNWDYRFCWLRDATFALLALLHAGYVDEAAAWRDWLLRAVAGEPANLQPLYSLSGKRRLTEWTADWLDGFEGSKPVRFGNAAAGQRQLDVYGEVIDALFQAERHGVAMGQPGRRLQRAIIDHVAETWREPDRGIWEMRGEPQRFTESQVMAWAAIDRAVRAGEALGADAPLDRWRALREEMHDEICHICFDPDQGAFTQAAGSKALDGSVLLIPHVGFLPADDPRMVGTVRAIQQNLMRNGFVLRYSPDETDDGVGGRENAFLACSFWLIDNLTLQGRRDEAHAMFERVMSARNEVGLLSEEYDPSRGELVGNFPQALSHLALVNTALSLTGWGPAQDRADGKQDGRKGQARAG